MGVGLAWLDRFGPLGATTIQLSKGQPMQIDSSRADFSTYRVHYHPNTEELHANELRVIALGTGGPTVAPSQVSSCWLVEIPSRTANHPERFLFDFGTGSMVKYGALQIPFEETRRAFISHLHSDHWGDFWSYWIGGVAQGRSSGISIWGPAGETPELGMTYAVNRAIDAMAWDVASREKCVPEGEPGEEADDGNVGDNEIVTSYRAFEVPGLNVTMHEFPASREVTLYDDPANGIVVKSWPADHALFGAVSFGLLWNGIKIVYSGDTKPLGGELEQFRSCFRGAHLLIHECFDASAGGSDAGGDLRAELEAVDDCVFHTTPEEFGELMAEYEPGHAVAFHFINDLNSSFDIYDRIRTNYAGPLTLAKDLQAWNVTPDEVLARNVAYHPDTRGDDRF